MMRAIHETAAAVVAATMALSACGPGTPRDRTGPSPPDVSDSIKQLESVRVFFAHQSVGDNVMDGVKALIKEAPGPSLDVVRLASTAGASGGFLAHETLGVNGDPKGKTDAFVSALEDGLGRDLDIALQKVPASSTSSRRRTRKRSFRITSRGSNASTGSFRTSRSCTSPRP